MSSTELQSTPSQHAGRHRHGLPGPVHTSSRLPAAETVVFTGVVPLLSIPLLVATKGAMWAAVRYRGGPAHG